jgi:hypothetical protein
MMNGAKFILFAGMCLGTAEVLASGCSSTPSAPGPGADSGPLADVHAIESGPDAADISCNPFTGDLCEVGQTCCFAGLGGTCTPEGACNAPFRFGCVSSASCGGTGVCCLGVEFPGADAAPLPAAPAVGSSGADASGFAVTLACASACPFPELQVCNSSQECQNGEVCAPTNPMGATTNRQIVFACVPPDGGADASDGGAGGGGDERDGMSDAAAAAGGSDGSDGSDGVSDAGAGADSGG